MNNETPKGLYGRPGNMDVLAEKISECEEVGLQIEIGLGPDKETDTVVIEDEGETVIRAIHKGEGVYIIMYNPEYYPKPAIPNGEFEDLSKDDSFTE